MSVREVLAELDALHSPGAIAQRTFVAWGDEPEDHLCVEGCEPGRVHSVIACAACLAESEDGDLVNEVWPCRTAELVIEAVAEWYAPSRHLVALSAWIDAHNAGKDLDLQLWERCGKVAEEAGEVAAALIGLLGQNPRKGVTHTREDLVGELLDVAITALGAVEHVDGNRGLAFDRLFAKLQAVAVRAGVLPNPGTGDVALPAPVASPTLESLRGLAQHLERKADERKTYAGNCEDRVAHPIDGDDPVVLERLRQTHREVAEAHGWARDRILGIIAAAVAQ